MFEIGTTLREARLRRQLDLVEAEQDTKIRSKYLAALENEEFDLLPGTVYARGFLRTYARYLGLNAQLYIDEYNERFGRFEDVDDANASVLARPAADLLPRRGPFTLRRVAVGCLILLAALAWLGLRTAKDPAAPSPSRNVVSPSKPGPLEAAGAEAGAQSAGSAATPQPAAADALSREQTATAVAASQLVLRSSSSSWLEVRAGGPEGALKFSGTFPANGRKTFAGKRLYVTVGVASAVQLRSGPARATGDMADAASYVVTPGRIKRV